MKHTVKKGVFVLVLVVMFAVVVTGGVFAQTQGLAFGARAIGIMPFFEAQKTWAHPLIKDAEYQGSFGFGAALHASYNFTDLLGVQAEFLINPYKSVARVNKTDTTITKTTSLLIPILFRAGYAFSSGLQLTGVVGPYFTLPLGEAESFPADGGQVSKYDWNTEVPVGGMIGGIVGYQLGPGVLFGDIRFAFDFTSTRLMVGKQTTSYKNERYYAAKSGLHIGVGYSIAIE